MKPFVSMYTFVFYRYLTRCLLQEDIVNFIYYSQGSPTQFIKKQGFVPIFPYTPTVVIS